MGKHFYGSSTVKSDAKILADHGAKNYRAGACYTPASDDSCKLNPADGVWTCLARAHHHLGSCGAGDIRIERLIAEDEPINGALNDESYDDAKVEDYS